MQKFRFILNRLSSFALTLFAASLIVFATLDLLPGNAAAILLGTAAKPDTIAALERQLGLDQPRWPESSLPNTDRPTCEDGR